jgi:hypothetical protein
MLKKVLMALGIILLVFVLITYGSLWSRPDDPELSIIINKEKLNSTSFKDMSTVQIAASTQYEGSTLKYLMQGKH